MQATLHDPHNAKTCTPVTDRRTLGECLIANHKLKDLIATELRAVGFDVVANQDACARTVHLPVDHWVDVGALCLLARSDEPACLKDKSGDLVAWVGARSPEDCSRSMVTEADCFRIHYPWNLLELNEEVLEMMEESNIMGEVSPLAEINGVLHLGKGSRILPGVVIEGNVIIGEDCKIGPNAYIRGKTSIGNHCEIGNAVEIKNSIIYSHTKVKHLSYVGDSILGSHVMVGAGTILANYRHDGTNHRSRVNGQLIDTGRVKLGAVLGDGVRTGVNTCVYPARKIGPGRMTRPNEIVDHDLLNGVS
ncbi:hypothetical protein JIN77_01285 [Verrucomicrobiaceae bacterium R5-34]|uniref:Mannose-1-phosphate guanyltransferase C-terminal domain-containing protein n=1 Tax=Oceaniferula flava TaxID=2800421 RepID=A0AAE2VBC0_9BACT|nr:hypothetical protein [Oceaniferula flavus]MBK1829344.1 hypothetical protein [Verrucomicrobiaceae bacterium R5-34]MBK1853571.1 hypothetical protein [Oceaniferula flavus]MBM1134876.1 hypothetical protein [Oceaniferula flavus]